MGRFARPAADKRAMMDYGYHLDTALYAAHLKSVAAGRGVESEAGEIGSVVRDGERITAIMLRGGGSIEGDLFVDCTARGALMDALGIEFEDWSGWLPCSHEVAVGTGALPDLPPVLDAVVHLSGWRRRLPLQHRTWHSLDYAPGEVVDEAALATLGGGEGDETRFTTYRRGRRQRFWAGNCVALGAAAVSIEPIEASELDIAASGIVALLSLFPDRGEALAEADEFDRVMAASVDAIRDLTLMHHIVIDAGKPILRTTGGGPDLPDSLMQRIELFRGRGRLRPGDASGLGPADWLAVLIGRGVFPTSWDPLADAIDIPRAQQNFLRLAGLFRQSAETMPDHAAYIARHCAYRP